MKAARLAEVSAAVFFLTVAGCSTGGDAVDVDPFDLGAEEGPGPDEPSAGSADPDPDDAGTGEGPSGELQGDADGHDGEPGDADEGHAASGAADGDDGEDADDAGDEAAGSSVPRLSDLAAHGVVDLTVAEPGTWPVGDAGTVTFDLDGRALVLRGIDGAPGWSIEVEEDERDEIEVHFRREGVHWRFAVERSGRHLEVEIDQRIQRAGAGGYDLGDAGTFAFRLEGGRLVLISLKVEDGWEVRDQDVKDDQIKLRVRGDDRQVDVEVELDEPDEIELEIEYRVRSRLP